METKRLFIALGFSFIFIVMWSILFNPQPITLEPITSEPITQDGSSKAGERVRGGGEENTKATKEDIEAVFINIHTELLQITLSNKGGGSIQKLLLVEKKNGGGNRYNGSYEKGEYIEGVPVTLIDSDGCNPCIVDNDNLFEFDRLYNNPIILNGDQSIMLRAELNGLIKTTTIYGNSYSIDHEYLNVNQDPTIKVVWESGLLPSEKNISEEITYLTAYMQEGENLKSFGIKAGDEPFDTDKKNEWAAVKTKYFMKAIVHFNNKAQTTKLTYDNLGLVGNNDFVYPVLLFEYTVPNNNVINFSSYIGPIDVNHLAKSDANLVDVFGFGWFIIGYLAKIVVLMLTTVYAFVPNYGVVCILFAIMIRLLTGPLTKKSFISNQKMQAIQPELKKIQEKFKDKPKELNPKILALYKKHKVNPLGGCLPILVQMPLLIALFQVFRKTIEFRGAAFLPFWITDLSQPDVVFSPAFLKDLWGISFFYGHGIALLPIIMGIIMMMNMKLSATTMQKSQMSTMYIMNIFFIMLFNTFPSGLNLYYTMYNLLNFLQQSRLKKIAI